MFHPSVKREVANQVAAPAETRTPNVHRAKRIAPRECGWKHGDSGHSARKKYRDQQKPKRIHLTPAGLLMEGHSAQNPPAQNEVLPFLQRPAGLRRPKCCGMGGRRYGQTQNQAEVPSPSASVAGSGSLQIGGAQQPRLTRLAPQSARRGVSGVRLIGYELCSTWDTLFSGTGKQH